jgi:PAS domain S-box-containing protein
MCNPTQCRYVAQASHLVLSVSAAGVIKGSNADAARTLGHNPAQLAGQRFSQLVAPNDRRRVGRILERCRANPTVWEDLTLLAADGNCVPMLCCLQRLATPGAKGALLVTGLRLDAMQDGGPLETASVLGQLTFRCHGPAHRLMQAVEAVLMQHPWSDAAERCRVELDRLLEVISLSVAPTQGDQTHEQAWAVRPIDAVRTVESALRLLDNDPAYQDIEIALRPELPTVWTVAHPVGLVFVTLHLVRNARDATRGRPSARLLIDIVPTETEVVLEFKDNGAGLEPEQLRCVFAPFMKTGANKGEHTGLGLATCDELLHHMGGKMRMESRPGKGTTVVVTLPVAAAPK